MTEEEMNAKLDELTASIKALETKNKELLTEKKKAKDEADAARELADEAEADKAREAKDIEGIEKRLNEKHAKEMAKLTETITGLTSEVTTFKVDNAIRENLSKHGFDAVHHDLLFDSMKSKARLDGSDAVIGDQAIEEYVSSFATSDVGKRYMPAPANGGGAAQGGKQAGTPTPDAWNFSTYTDMKKSGDTDGAKAYAAKHNQPFAS